MVVRSLILLDYRVLKLLLPCTVGMTQAVDGTLCNNMVCRGYMDQVQKRHLVLVATAGCYSHYRYNYVRLCF
jgi:hypothetical protein